MELIPTSALDNALEIAEIFAFMEKERRNMRGFARALMIADRLVMRASSLKPDESRFLVWTATEEQILNIFEEIEKLRGRLRLSTFPTSHWIPTGVADRLVDRLSFERADAYAKVANHYNLVLSYAQVTGQSNPDLEVDHRHNLALTLALLRRADITQPFKA